MKILVTGGAGYIGSHVSMTLKSHGFLPICYDNLSTGHKNAVLWGPFFYGDLKDTATLEKVFQKQSPIAVMHFAANASVSESLKDPGKYYENNVACTINLLQTMRKFRVPYLIFSSSCSIFGIPKKIPIVENIEKLPITPYGQSKLMIEKILEDFQKAYPFHYASLRYFNAAGADFQGMIGEHHQQETHLIPLAIQAVLKQIPYLKIYGTDYPTKDGTAVRDYIHVMDLAEAHIKALQYLLEKKKSLCLNLGTNQGFSVLEVVQEIEKQMQLKIPLQYRKKRKGDPPVLLADNKKAKKLLHWSPQYSTLKTIITSALLWHKKLLQ